VAAITKIKKLVRPKKGRVIAGVSLALANYFGIDAVLVRVIWVILLIPGGIPGILPYLACWIIIPSEKNSHK
jgi:phage shock protein PspC (stress-responsive transcriptional regulator)